MNSIFFVSRKSMNSFGVFGAMIFVLPSWNKNISGCPEMELLVIPDDENKQTSSTCFLRLSMASLGDRASMTANMDFVFFEFGIRFELNAFKSV